MENKIPGISKPSITYVTLSAGEDKSAEKLHRHTFLCVFTYIDKIKCGSTQVNTAFSVAIFS